MLGKRVREEEKREEKRMARSIKSMLGDARHAKGSAYEMTKLAEIL